MRRRRRESIKIEEEEEEEEEGIKLKKTIINSWERCLENNQMVINSGFPTVNCRK